MGFKHIVHHVKELPNLQNAISNFKRNSELLSSNGLIRNEFIKLIGMGNYIRHKWVNHIDQRVKSALLTTYYFLLLKVPSHRNNEIRHPLGKVLRTHCFVIAY